MERKVTPVDGQIYSDDWRAWTDPEVPERIYPIHHLIERHAGGAGADRTALVCDGERISYAALRDRVERTGAALSRAGCHPGERILLFGTDSLDYVCIWLGAVRIGAIPVVVSDLYKAGDLSYFLDDTDAATLFIDEEQLGKLDAIAADLPPALRRVVVRGKCAATDAGPERRDLSALMAEVEGQAAAPAWRWHSNDVCYMFYSGGTTGKAKGITHLAHDFYIVPARQAAFWEYRPEDVVYASSRKYFTHGLWPGILIPLAIGACGVVDRRPPSPDVVLEILETQGVTKFISVPTILKQMLQFARNAPDKPDLSAVSLVISASEKISPEVFESFEQTFGLEILDSIGSSEITYEWIANRPREFRRGSLGKPVFGCELRLVGPDGEDVTEPGVPGEAWVRSRTSCLFYWRKLDKSRDTFIGDWTRTGDNLFFDEDGFFWFSGRDNDVFKVKGLWVSPIEVEAAVASHDAVHETAVVSFDGADGLTQCLCYAVLEQGHHGSAELIEELKARVRPLGGYKVPSDFRFVDALPRTTLMKIDRRTLRENPDMFG